MWWIILGVVVIFCIFSCIMFSLCYVSALADKQLEEMYKNIVKK